MDKQIFTFCMPDIGEGVVEGEIVEWLKQEGNMVSQDEPVLSLMTDKATVELPSPYPGKIVKRYFKAGEKAFRGKPLYDIEVAGVLPLYSKKSTSTRQSGESKVKSEEPHTHYEERLLKESNESIGKQPAIAIPRVRQMARQMGIDIEQIEGTGKEGRVNEEDLRKYLKPYASECSGIHLPGDEEQSLAGIPGLMARRMEKTRIPQFSYFEYADAVQLNAMYNKIKVKAEKEGVFLSYMPFLIRALSLAIRKFPLLNASIDMGKLKLTLHKVHNIGIAMASPQGLIVPVLKGVEGMDLTQIIRQFDALKKKAKEGSLSSSDMKRATITISNFGSLGDGLFATPLISESESAILAIAKMREVPLAKNGAVLVRNVFPLSWSFDHRVIDGKYAADVSSQFCRLLRDPASLL